MRLTVTVVSPATGRRADVVIEAGPAAALARVAAELDQLMHGIPAPVQRALASLSAELTRRERLLAAAGAKDIEEYAERGGRLPGHHRCPGW